MIKECFGVCLKIIFFQLRADKDLRLKFYFVKDIMECQHLKSFETI